MSIAIEKDKCIGCGTCVHLCSKCFKLADDGKAEVISDDCQECDLKEVASNCAVDAIKIN